MKNFLKIFFLMAILAGSFSIEVEAQREKGKTAQEQMKDQVKMKQERKQKMEEDLKMRKEHHLKIQDKKTRKRMKKNQRMQERARKGNKVPFYKRWFRKRTFK